MVHTIWFINKFLPYVFVYLSLTKVWLLFNAFMFNCSLFFVIDVTETLLVEVDRIYHLACPASPIFYKYNPVKVKTSILQSLNSQQSIYLSSVIRIAYSLTDLSGVGETY